MFKLATIIGSLLFILMAGEVLALQVSPNEVALALEKEFIEQGIDQEVELELFSGQTSFQASGAKSSKLMVSGMKIDEANGRFSCDLEVFFDGKPIEKTQIIGKFYPLRKIFVPVVNLNKGDIVSTDNLKMMKIRAARVKADDIVDEEKLVGKEMRRPVSAGKVISNREIGEPIIIKKGDKVTIVYVTPNMQITAKAEALGDGFKGGKVDVVNIKSKKIISAEVVDKNTVKVD